MPMDSNGKSDPYLRLVCGGQKVSRRAQFFAATLEPDFFQVLEVRVSLPGAPPLRLEVWDRDEMPPDDLIGVTSIDIEDRWYEPSWRALGVKPIETRTLYSTRSTSSQGALRLWVDMHPVGKGHVPPALWNIAPPPPYPWRCAA